MKDEIKEILDRLHYIVFDNETIDYVEEMSLTECKLLLDHITNLQKEVRINNDLIPYFKNRVKSLKKSITNLQEENERLRKEIELCKKNGNL